MKRLIFLFIVFFSITAIGCKPQSAISKSTQSEKRDGSTYENAIVAKSIESEYKWIRTQYPGSQVVSQSLSFKDEKPFDILTVKLAEGSEKQVYFDISKFFGKF
jgi:hypothetical protein